LRHRIRTAQHSEPSGSGPVLVQTRQKAHDLLDREIEIDGEKPAGRGSATELHHHRLVRAFEARLRVRRNTGGGIEKRPELVELDGIAGKCPLTPPAGETLIQA